MHGETLKFERLSVHCTKLSGGALTIFGHRRRVIRVQLVPCVLFVKQETAVQSHTIGYSVGRRTQHCTKYFVLSDVHKFTDSTHHDYDVTVLIDDALPIVYLARLTLSASASSSVSHGRTGIIDLKMTGWVLL